MLGRRRTGATGTVVDVLPNAMFHLELDTGQNVLADACGQMLRQCVRVLCGSKAKVEISPKDVEKGSIIYHSHKDRL